MRRSILFKICKIGITIGSVVIVYTALVNTLPDNDDRHMDPMLWKYVQAGRNELKKLENVAQYKDVKENVLGKIRNVRDNIGDISAGQYGVYGYSSDISLLSAVVGNSSSRTWDYTTIQGWEHVKYENNSFACCFMYKSGSIKSTNTSNQLSWKHDKRALMVAKQYVCPNPRSGSEGPPVGVTITGTKNLACHRKISWYLPPYYARDEKKIVTCTKVVHKNISENDVLSWFEVHKKLGMEKVFVYTYDLAQNIDKILQHYKAMGIAELIPFRLPKYYKGKQVREIESKDVKEWNIEQTLINDCFERSKGYKYVVVLDINQYLIPKQVDSWPKLFDQLYNIKKAAAGFAFNVNLHITSWAVGNHTSQFTAGRYFNHTLPQDRNVKHVTQPEAVSGLSINAFTPLRGYREFRAPEGQATVHHFRSCKKSNDWEDDVDTTCKNMGNYYEDKHVANILAPLEDSIIKLKISISNKA